MRIGRRRLYCEESGHIVLTYPAKGLGWSPRGSPGVRCSDTSKPLLNVCLRIGKRSHELAVFAEFLDESLARQLGVESDPMLVSCGGSGVAVVSANPISSRPRFVRIPLAGETQLYSA
ncbi:uncharacterized [Tachysurus ichikawai]